MGRVALIDQLREGRVVVGTMVSQVRTPALAVMLAEAGLDFFILDCEHGSYSSESVADLCQMALEAGIAPIVRIPQISRETILRPLDSGADGILVPQVETAEEAKEVVAWAKYPPLGRRGAVVRRAHARYTRPPGGAFLEERNRATLVAVQIESAKGLANCEAIAEVEGVDSLFVGPFDLSVSLGHPGDLAHPEVSGAMRRIFDVAKAAGKVPGIHLADASKGSEWIKSGGRLVSLGGDVEFIVDGARGVLDGVRPLL